MSNTKHKITDQIRNLSTEKASFSFEFFPPKTQQGFENLKSRIQRMTELGPAFVTVTWGVGGSTADKSLKLAKYAQQLGNVVCLHLTCTNMDKSILDTALEKAKRLGISNILALRGDPPRNEEYGDNLVSDFVHAVDLVKYIRKSHGDFFCIGVAGYPEGHTDGSDMSEQDPVKDIPYLEEKVRAGADFIITQLFYDVDKFVDYENMLRNHESGIFKDIDIIPGLMPINTYQSFVRSSKLSHASVPPALMDKLTEIKGNDESVKQFGVDALSEIISQAYHKTNGRTRVFHFYTLNLERSVALILEVCSAFQISDMLKTEPKSLENDNVPLNGYIPTFNRQLSASAHNKAITNQPEINNLSVPESIVNAGISKPSRPLDFFAISAGEGTLGRQANWDDFPNGRFGDSRSPAFGEIDGYGPNLHADNKKAYKLWGHPVNKKDISTLFISHITGKLSAIPWSDQSLDPETALIQEQLIELNNRQMWTLSSQPACDSVKSSDKIFGWGPQSGWVFQKAYVEFFVSSEMFDKLIKEKIGAQNTYQTVTYYACDSRGKFVTNEEKGSSNIVTWGVFPNREILQSTLIERESFSAWADEAFCLWKEWQKLYAKNTPSHNLIEEVLNDYYLVTIIHHDFKKEFGLWDLLLDTKL